MREYKYVAYMASMLYVLFFIPFYTKGVVVLDYIIRIISFSKNKHEKFNHCPKCFGETRHRKLQDEELDFREVLNKAIHKRNNT